MMGQEQLGTSHPSTPLFYPKADAPFADEQLRDWRNAGREAIPHAIAEQLGDVCGMFLGAFPESVMPLEDQGTFHWLFRVAGDDGQSWIARVARPDVPAAARTLLVDAWAHRRLHRAGLPSLEVSTVDVTCSLAPFAFELLSEARGRSLRSLDHEDEALRPVLVDLGRRLVDLHSLTCEGFGLMRPVGSAGADVVGECATWSDYLVAHLERHVSICRDIGALTKEESQRTGQTLADIAPRLTLERASLLHGDLGNHNLFTDGARLTHLIDWEDCLAGDPVFDLAFWATFHPERRHAWLLESYAAAVADRGMSLPPDFDLRFWAYFLRVSLAKTVLRARLGIKDAPGRPPASARLQLALQKLRGLEAPSIR